MERDLKFLIKFHDWGANADNAGAMLERLEIIRGLRALPSREIDQMLEELGERVGGHVELLMVEMRLRARG
jgi:hypothetical protein